MTLFKTFWDAFLLCKTNQINYWECQVSILCYGANQQKKELHTSMFHQKHYFVKKNSMNFALSDRKKHTHDRTTKKNIVTRIWGLFYTNQIKRMLMLKYEDDFPSLQSKIYTHNFDMALTKNVFSQIILHALDSRFCAV